MATNLNIAGIAQSGNSGSYTYAVIGNGNRPVTYVSMLDTMRFANWVNNGQPVGSQNSSTTEDGAYTLSLGGLAPRNAGASVFVTSENEWYKAAYYDPTKGGSNYWLYPTRSDSAPGNVVGGGANQANYNNGVFSVTQSGSYSTIENYLTPVGTFTQASGHYETYDQGGNVTEWNEAILYGTDRIVRGGTFLGNSTNLESSLRGNLVPTYEALSVGFRLASVVPEPSVIGSLIFGGAMMLARRRRGI